MSTYINIYQHILNVICIYIYMYIHIYLYMYIYSIHASSASGLQDARASLGLSARPPERHFVLSSCSRTQFRLSSCSWTTFRFVQLLQGDISTCPAAPQPCFVLDNGPSIVDDFDKFLLACHVNPCRSIWLRRRSICLRQRSIWLRQHSLRLRRRSICLRQRSIWLRWRSILAPPALH